MIDSRRYNPGKLLPITVLLAIIVSLSFQGSRGLYETTEGRYAECAREMIETGNYLEPTLNYRPHWSKPPMTYWAIAGGIKLLGRSEWGVRLYNVLAFVFTTLAISGIGAALWDRETGIIAGLIYASSPFPVFGAFAVSTDTLLAMWEILAVLCYVRARHASSQAAGKRWMAAMWLSFGLAFLTKGPPGLFPLIPIVIWHIQNRPPLKLVNPTGIVLFLLTGLSWFLVVCYLHPGLVSYYLGTEIIDRIASNSVHNPEWYKPFTKYLPVLTVGAGPWLYYGLKLIKQKRLFSPGVLRSYLKKGDDKTFLLIWLALPLVIFSIVKSRLPLYVLPLYAPIALIVARGICTAARNSRELRRVLIISTVTIFILIGMKGVASVFPNQNDMRPLYTACKNMGGADAEFLTFYRPKLYGLQYYLDGALKRASFDGKEPWADAGVYSILENAGKPDSRRYLFITDRDKAAVLSETIEKSGVSFARFNSGKYWVIFAVPNGKAAGPSSQ